MYDMIFQAHTLYHAPPVKLLQKNIQAVRWLTVCDRRTMAKCIYTKLMVTTKYHQHSFLVLGLHPEKTLKSKNKKILLQLVIVIYLFVIQNVSKHEEN